MSTSASGRHRRAVAGRGGQGRTVDRLGNAATYPPTGSVQPKVEVWPALPSTRRSMLRPSLSRCTLRTSRDRAIGPCVVLDGTSDGSGVLLEFDGVPGGIGDPDLHRVFALHGSFVLDAERLELGDRRRRGRRPRRSSDVRWRRWACPVEGRPPGGVGDRPRRASVRECPGSRAVARPPGPARHGRSRPWCRVACRWC